MNAKQLRRHRTKELIRENSISSQEELLTRLRNEGFELTQATLSRDLKKMNVSKVACPDNSYRYNIPDESPQKQIKGESGFVSIEFTGSLAVIKTIAGYASPMAVLMDNRPSSIVKGTIAGRDTIFVALSEEEGSRDKFEAYMKTIISEAN